MLVKKSTNCRILDRNEKRAPIIRKTIIAFQFSLFKYES
jgi:hypothetical protein